MGCFLTCFGGAKEKIGRRRRHRRSPKRSLSKDLSPQSGKILQLNAVSLKQVTPQITVAALLLELPAESREGNEDRTLNIIKKKVTFDPNVKTYEMVVADDEEDDIFQYGVDEYAETEQESEELRSKPEAYPLNYRYRDCSDSDNEDDYEEDEQDYDDDNEDFEECEIDEVDNTFSMREHEEESYESLFSLSMDKEKEQESNQEEVISPTPKSTASCDPSKYKVPVLNPVENISQWKEIKARAVLPKNLDKENIILAQENMEKFSPELMMKSKKQEQVSTPSPSKQEVSVDASLSTWLASSNNSVVQRSPESNSVRSYSSLSREDRPILGALTVEDINQSESVMSSPRKSPSRSPDDIPILGTVGSYWSCTSEEDDGSSCNSCRYGSVTKKFSPTKSRFREDRRVNCR